MWGNFFRVFRVTCFFIVLSPWKTSWEGSSLELGMPCNLSQIASSIMCIHFPLLACCYFVQNLPTWTQIKTHENTNNSFWSSCTHCEPHVISISNGPIENAPLPPSLLKLFCYDEEEQFFQSYWFESRHLLPWKIEASGLFITENLLVNRKLVHKRLKQQSHGHQDHRYS